MKSKIIVGLGVGYLGFVRCRGWVGGSIGFWKRNLKVVVFCVYCLFLGCRF